MYKNANTQNKFICITYSVARRADIRGSSDFQGFQDISRVTTAQEAQKRCDRGLWGVVSPPQYI